MSENLDPPGITTRQLFEEFDGLSALAAGEQFLGLVETAGGAGRQGASNAFPVNPLTPLRRFFGLLLEFSLSMMLARHKTPPCQTGFPRTPSIFYLISSARRSVNEPARAFLQRVEALLIGSIRSFGASRSELHPASLCDCPGSHLFLVIQALVRTLVKQGGDVHEVLQSFSLCLKQLVQSREYLEQRLISLCIRTPAILKNWRLTRLQSPSIIVVCSAWSGRSHRWHFACRVRDALYDPTICGHFRDRRLHSGDGGWLFAAHFGRLRAFAR